ncbi:hypothetical protein HYU16_04915 [Candidatus Woesearchaeota archaeon]|nr:hypothetical protein [Candidatus Woesearchaeota archaeon]
MRDYRFKDGQRLEHIVHRTLPHAKRLANILTGIDNFVSIYKAALTVAHNPRAIPNALYTTAFGLMSTTASLTADTAIAGTIYKIAYLDPTNLERAADIFIGLFGFLPVSIFMYVLGRRLNEYIQDTR